MRNGRWAGWLWLFASPAWALNLGLGSPPPSVDRETPYAAVHGYLEAAHAGEYDVAAHYLRLDHVPVKDQSAVGAALARRFRFVLDAKLWIDFTKISRSPEGDAASSQFDTVGVIELAKSNQPIRVQRMSDGNGGTVWVFSAETVRAIDKLYELYGPPLGETLPEFFFRYSFGAMELWQWLGWAVLLAGAVGVGWVLQALVLAVGLRAARLTSFTWDELLIARSRGPLAVVIWGILVSSLSHLLRLSVPVQMVTNGVSRSLTIIAVAWLLMRWLKATVDYAQDQVWSKTKDPLKVRGAQTQMAVLQRVVRITYFLEKPFQNWSKGAFDKVGSLDIQVHRNIDVDALKAELKRIVENEGRRLWDGRVQSLAVTRTTDNSLVLRAIVSASDPGTSWELRSLIREKLLEFIGQHPEWEQTNEIHQTA